MINGICLTQESFLQTLKFAAFRGKMIPEAELSPSAESEKNLTQFLLHVSFLITMLYFFQIESQ